MPSQSLMARIPAPSTAPVDDRTACPLVLTGLSVGYGPRQVVSAVDLTVTAGELFGLIGMNGAGKTTLIKTILGLRRPLAGTAALFGGDPAVPDHRTRVAYLPENLLPSRTETGREFLSTAMGTYGLALDESAVRSLAEALRFEVAVLDHRIGRYSKGMVQKLGLMATFLPERPMLILDEPMTGLDAEARGLVKAAFQAHRARGGTILFTSHILSDLDELCDRIGLIRHGRLEFLGLPAALKAATGQPTLESAFLALLRDSGSAEPAAKVERG